MHWDEFEGFVDAELPRLLGYARALTGSPHDAWDLTQETLVRVGLRWGAVERSGSPAGYARTTMARLNVDRFRRSSRERLTADVPDRPASAVDDVGLDPWVIAALGALTPHQRTAVVLRFVDDLDLAGIARVMGCSAGTVKSHLSRGIARMREHAPAGEPGEHRGR